MPKLKKDEPVIFSGKLNRAIEYFVDCRDPEKAALLADMDPVQFRRFMKHEDVKQKIDKKIDLIDKATAELVAKSRMLSALFLDQHLIMATKKGAARGDVRALELGYERIGLRRDNNFMTTDQSSTQTRPHIYRVLEQTITKTEQVTQRQIIAGVPQPALEAPPMRLQRASTDEILEY